LEFCSARGRGCEQWGMTNSRVWQFVVVAAVAGLLGGCAAPSMWEKSLAKSKDASLVALDAAAPVTVRDVAWDRVQSTLREIEAARAASDVHPDEWSEDRKLAEKQMLLRGLQISQAAGDVTILGSSQFRTTDGIGDPQVVLPKIARSLGANRVIWSSRVLGKADKIVQEPVSSNRFGTVWYRDRDDRYRNDSYNEQQTTWVPVRVSADEVGGIAFYLRVID
jgi:hypothetical protein